MNGLSFLYDPLLSKLGPTVNKAVNYKSNGVSDTPSSPSPKRSSIDAEPLKSDQVKNLVDTMQAGRVERETAKKEFDTAHNNWAELRGGIGNRMLTMGGITWLYAWGIHNESSMAATAIFGGIMAVGAAVKSYGFYQDAEYAAQSQIIRKSDQAYNEKEKQASKRSEQLKQDPNAAPVILDAQKTSLAADHQELHDKIYGPAAAKDKRGGQVLNAAGMLGLAGSGTVALMSSELHVIKNSLIHGAAEAVGLAGFLTAGDAKDRQDHRAKATVEFYEAQQGISSNFDKKVPPGQAKQAPSQSNASADDGVLGNLKKMFMGR